MSAALVQKSLEIVDPECVNKKSGLAVKKVRNVFNLIPKAHTVTRKVNRKGQKAKNVNLLSKNKKLSVRDIKRNFKSKEEILKENIRKLKLIEEASKIHLDKQITNQIIERAVTKRPTKVKKHKHKKPQKTAFTEEDFKKFEEEYTG